MQFMLASFNYKHNLQCTCLHKSSNGCLSHSYLACLRCVVRLWREGGRGSLQSSSRRQKMAETQLLTRWFESTPFIRNNGVLLIQRCGSCIQSSLSWLGLKGPLHSFNHFHFLLSHICLTSYRFSHSVLDCLLHVLQC